MAVTMDRIAPWRTSATAAAYKPAVPYRRLVLSPRATLEVYEQTDPKGAPGYILIDTEGMLRAEGHMYAKWPNARTVAMWENLAMYNCRSHTCVRVVWQQEVPALRTSMNFNLEPVRLLPAPEVLDKMPDSRKLARIFKGLDDNVS